MAGRGVECGLSDMLKVNTFPINELTPKKGGGGGRGFTNHWVLLAPGPLGANDGGCVGAFGLDSGVFCLVGRLFFLYRDWTHTPH